MKLATTTKFATTTLLAASLMVVGIGCGETGSTINGGDPVPERANPEPPYSPETTDLDVPEDAAGSDNE